MTYHKKGARALSALSVLALVGLQACAAGGTDRLGDRTVWTPITLEGKAINPQNMGRERLKLQFDGTRGTFVGADGCNMFKGHYEQKEGRIKLSPPVATRRACLNQADAAVSTRYMDALGKVDSFFREGNDRLILKDTGGSAVAEFNRVEDATAAGEILDVPFNTTTQK